MARHRNVRSMNYNDEYDGYDDVYGHSVEDEYCVSPSDEAQFMYDRTRQPQIAAFFNEQDNIIEEDENIGQSTERKNSECFTRPTLSDLDEAKLLSCLDEIRNVIGDSISEKILVETILKCDLNVNKSLDSILTNATSSSEPSSDALPQSIRKDRDRDSMNCQSDFLCLRNNGIDNKLSENLNVINVQDSDCVFCYHIYFNENVQNTGKFQFNKLIVKPCNIASCNSEAQPLNENLCFMNISRSSDVDFTKADFNVHCTNLLLNEIENSNIKETSSSSNANANRLFIRYDESQGICSLKTNEKEPGIDFEKFSIRDLDSKMESLSDAYSSDEDFSSLPLAALHRRKKVELADECESLKNLKIQERSKHDKILNVASGIEPTTVQDKESPGDDSDEEKNTFSPLAALASRHHKEISNENNLSENKLQFVDSFLSKTQTLMTFRKNVSDRKTSGECVEITNSSNVKSFSGDRSFSSDGKMTYMVPHGRSYDDDDDDDDDEDQTISPLAALADRYHKEKDDSCSPYNTDCKLKNKVLKNENEGEAKEINTLCKLSARFPYRTVCKEKKHDPEDLHYEKQKERSIPNPQKREGPFDLAPNKSASSLSDLASFHLTTSASCSGHSPLGLHHKAFPSDCGISRSLPAAAAFPPFLKSRRGSTSEAQCPGDGAAEQADPQGGFLVGSGAEGADEWVIDLSSALRDPGLQAPCSLLEEKTPAQIVKIVCAEVEEEEDDSMCLASLEPCQLDSSGILKMKFSCSKRKCSAFGQALCRQWRDLARPYILPAKRFTGTILPFSFSTKSRDDEIMLRLNIKK